MQMRHWVDTMAAKLDVPLQPPTQQPDAWCMSRFVPARFFLGFKTAIAPRARSTFVEDFDLDLSVFRTCLIV